MWMDFIDMFPKCSSQWPHNIYNRLTMIGILLHLILSAGQLVSCRCSLGCKKRMRPWHAEFYCFIYCPSAIKCNKIMFRHHLIWMDAGTGSWTWWYGQWTWLTINMYTQVKTGSPTITFYIVLSLSLAWQSNYLGQLVLIDYDERLLSKPSSDYPLLRIEQTSCSSHATEKL